MSFLKRPLAAAVGGDGVAVAFEEIFVSREPFESDRAACVELGGAYPQLRAEAVTEAIGEARRGVVVDARRVHLREETRRTSAVFGHDCLRVARAVALDVSQRFVKAADRLDRDDHVGIL